MLDFGVLVIALHKARFCAEFDLFENLVLVDYSNLSYNS